MMVQCSRFGDVQVTFPKLNVSPGAIFQDRLCTCSVFELDPITEIPPSAAAHQPVTSRQPLRWLQRCHSRSEPSTNVCDGLRSHAISNMFACESAQLPATCLSDGRESSAVMSIWTCNPFRDPAKQNNANGSNLPGSVLTNLAGIHLAPTSRLKQVPSTAMQ